MSHDQDDPAPRAGGRRRGGAAEWHDLFTRVYRIALDLGNPCDDSGLASLQDEARRRLPEAGLTRRVVVTATAP